MTPDGSPRGHELAELNIARAVAPMDHPAMADFVANLARINALGDRSPGFVWRLQDETGAATAIRAFDDPLVIVNLTVWTTVGRSWPTHPVGPCRGLPAATRMVRPDRRPQPRPVVGADRPPSDGRRGTVGLERLADERPDR